MILSIIVIVSKCRCQKHKCRLSTEWNIEPLYLCNCLENTFPRHSTFVLSTINMISAGINLLVWLLILFYYSLPVTTSRRVLFYSTSFSEFVGRPKWSDLLEVTARRLPRYIWTLKGEGQRSRSHTVVPWFPNFGSGFHCCVPHWDFLVDFLIWLCVVCLAGCPSVDMIEHVLCIILYRVLIDFLAVITAHSLSEDWSCNNLCSALGAWYF